MYKICLREPVQSLRGPNKKAFNSLHPLYQNARHTVGLSCKQKNGFTIFKIFVLPDFRPQGRKRNKKTVNKWSHMDPNTLKTHENTRKRTNMHEHL